MYGGRSAKSFQLTDKSEGIFELRMRMKVELIGVGMGIAQENTHIHTLKIEINTIIFINDLQQKSGAKVLTSIVFPSSKK
jgi:hypothetical protein